MEDTRGVAADDAAAEVGSVTVRTRAASEFLKALAHEGRLAILCSLIDGERSVGELEALLGARQAAVSQQLARLRHEGLVRARREGKTIYYTVDDSRVRLLIETLHALFSAAPRD